MIFLCYGSPGECQNCGGSTSAEGGDIVDGVWVPDGTRGPFLGDTRYCSELCWEEAQEFMLREAQRRAIFDDCCPVCGYDQHEHDLSCPATAGPLATMTA